MTTALAALVIPLACAGGATAASTSVWPSAAALGLPSGASASQAATSLPSVSCGSSVQCVAVGAYSGASDTEPMALTATSGTWAAPTTITPVSGATASALESVSCSAASTCIAVGQDTNSGTHPIAATQSSGVWSGASELSGLPSGASGGSLSGISCKAGNNCSAVGSATVSGVQQPIAMNVAAGTFGQAVQVGLPSGAQSGGLNAVACTTPGNCEGVGSFKDAGGQTQAMVAAETAGTWAAATAVTLPGGADATQDAQLTSIACPASGHCAAVGSYVNAAGQTAAMVDAQSGASWAPAVALALPSGTTASVLQSVSCASSGNCTATGYSVAVTASPLAATESGGAWSAATTLPTPSGATSSGSLSAFEVSVGCTGSEKCQAVGTYPDAAGLGAMALNSHPSLSVSTSSLPRGVIGKAYSAKLATSGGTGDDAWTLTGGSLPAGLSFNNGVISGTPTTDQTTTFSVAVHDGASPPDQATATLSLTIGPAVKPPKTTKKKSGSKSGGKKKSKKGKKGAKLGAFKVVHGSAVRVKITCVDQRHCNGRVALVVIEHLRGKRVIAINSSTHRAHGTRTKTVWLGSLRYALRGGHHVTRTIHLGRAGTRLLKAKRKLDVAVALRTASSKRATIEHRVKLHEHKTKKHKAKKHKHGKKSGAHKHKHKGKKGNHSA
ncbi:MAG TPA: putative Ig domain-containing protein [Solirubrobacteraceae bacterium]|nr:putative Ig domain-containing protein [Solirubrobacteraceae bacterium]